MRVIIVEDEKPSAEKLMRAIHKTDDSIEVLTIADSIQSTTEWLKNNDMPDLVFMDIELADGLSFKIFEKVNITCPVIFCTAYDEYWQEAFEYSSIDYLLKPVKEEKLKTALGKFEKLKQYFFSNLQKLKQWKDQAEHGGCKKRFLVKRGSDYFSIKTEDIAYFYAAHKLVCLVENNGRKFIMDQSLSDIEKQVDPGLFYRVNRKYLIQLNAIRKIKTLPKSKLQLEIEPAIDEDIIISQENASAFKEWMGQ